MATIFQVVSSDSVLNADQIKVNWNKFEFEFELKKLKNVWLKLLALGLCGSKHIGKLLAILFNL